MEPEPKPQSDGSGGRIGGPPVVACGYCGDGDEKPRRKHKRARRAGPATSVRPAPSKLRLYLKDVFREAKRICWPSAGEFTGTLAGTIFGLAILISIAGWIFSYW